MDHVYQLNLPALQNFVQDSAYMHDDNHLTENTLLFRDCSNLFINNVIQGIKFVSILYLKKDNKSGIIHKDGINGGDEFHFGINFNLFGTMKLKYWLPEHVEPIGKQTTDNDYAVNYPMYSPLTEPDYVYVLEPEKVYLINASIPHCGESMSFKKSISLRTNIKEKNRLQLNDWISVVNHFSDIIV